MERVSRLTFGSYSMERDSDLEDIETEIDQWRKLDRTVKMFHTNICQRGSSSLGMSPLPQRTPLPQWGRGSTSWPAELRE